MKKMHYNKQCNNLIKSEINNKNRDNFLSSTIGGDRNGQSESSLTFEVNTTDRNTIKQHNGESDIGTFKGATTSCTSSTDSGVNISDNDEIPPSPTSSYLHSFPSSTSSSSGTASLNLLNTQYHKNYKNTNRDNNKNNNNNKRNEYNNHILNVNNEDDDDDINNSTKVFDNKLKIEQHRKRQQQFLNVENKSNEGNNTRYQPNQNIIESENAVSHQLYLTTAKPTITVTTNNNNNNKNYTATSLQHNEFISRPQRSASISSSLSLSSTNTNSYDHNPQPKMHHCNGSPVVSIRSINSSTIITSDSDSDSDLNGDIEGVHENYVIKKLGTQVTYPPNHPNIPNINSGHTILNQKIVPNDDQVLTSPLAVLAAVGDNIGAAQALGPIPSLSAVPQRPQIGSIALSNSSDVTFGDKHFYEGPVTIQQFLIDGRDKFNETNGNDNPSFVNDNNETINNAKDINSSPVQSGKRKKLIILGVLATMVLLIVATVLGSKALNDSKSKHVFGNSEESRNNIPIHSTIAQDNVGGGYVLRIVPRDGWLAQPSINDLIPLKHPIERVIVIPTRTSECETQAACTYTVRITQTFNIESQQQDDIIYNFLIGGDGNVYEGRGWDFRGSVLKGFNNDTISFAYIGSFKKQPPSYKQLNVTKLLLEEGVRLNKLSSNYRLVGGNKLDPTSVTTLADALYKSFENWPHWSDY